MFYFVLAIHLLLCLSLIGLVLLQQGKGASVGAVLSGSSNTLFGATGANTLLVKVTTIVAVSFMVTSIVLVKMYGGAAVRSAESSSLSGKVLNTLVPETSEVQGSGTTSEEQPKEGEPVKNEVAPAAVPPAPVPEAEHK